MSILLNIREQSNLTQNELADKSGVSVRTIQRIEAGADLKGHTLKAISAALEVDPSDFVEKSSQEEAYNYQLIKMINLSSILFLIPFGNILIPLLIMHFKKAKNPITKQIVSLQIMWMIATVFAVISVALIQKGFLLSKFIVPMVLMICFLINIYMVFRNTSELDRNKKLHIKLNYSVI